MKQTIIILLVLVLVGVGAYIAIKGLPAPEIVPQDQAATPPPSTNQPQGSVQTSTVPQVDKTKTVIGKTAEGRDIVAYHYGTGSKELLFVGGIHGGYEWNTTLLAYELMNYLKTNPAAVPANVKVTVVPVLNPDGLSKVVSNTASFSASDVSPSKDVQVSGRYNARNVDLNRNFDCDWQATGVWQSTPVSGGNAAFSEPESKAIRDYVTAHRPTAAVVWYSAAGGVFSSNCHNGVSAGTERLTNVYADASGYPASKSYDFYEITGDMVNWLAKNDIPAVSVLLSTHTDIEWSKNLAGIRAVLQNYAQ